MPVVSVRDYSEKAILLEGDTKYFATHINETLKGKWNDTLKGWIFPKTRKVMVEDFVKQANAGNIAPEVENKVKSYVSREDFLAVVSRLERLEAQMSQVLANKIEPTPVVSITKGVEQVDLRGEGRGGDGGRGGDEDDEKPQVTKFKRKLPK